MSKTTIQDIKNRFNFSDEDIAKLLRLKNAGTYKNSTAKKRYDDIICDLVNLVDSESRLKDKKIKDLINWVKSDLKQETNNKLSKTATPYRMEKIKFLSKLMELECV